MGEASRPKRPWAALGAILLVSLVGYGHLLAPGQVPFNRYSDFVAQHLTTKTVLHESLRAGRGIPFWRSDQFCGYIGLTNPQTMYTYPLHFLFYLLPPVKAAGPTDYLHFLVAALAFYALGAVLELGRWGRVFLAVAGMFNFKLLLASFAGWTPVIPIIAWHPALLAAVVYAVKRPGPVAAAVLALVGGLCLHCGQIQLLYYFTWFAVAYVLVAVVPQVRRGQWAAAGRTVLWLSLGGILAAGLATYLLLPMAASAMHSTRTGVSYRFFLAGRTLTAAHLLTFLYPEALGTPLDGSYQGTELWEDVGYFGIIPLALAVAGVVWAWRRPHARFLTVALVISGLLAFNTWFTRLAYYFLPGFRLFRVPGRFLFLSATFGIALAGVGLEELLARVRARRGPGKSGAAVALAGILLVGAEGTYYARRYLTTAPQAQALPPRELRDLFAADGSLYRVAPRDRYSLNAGWAAPLNIQSVGGYDAFNYAHFGRYLDLMQTGDLHAPRARVWFEVSRLGRQDMLDALNVRYFVSLVPLIFPESGFERTQVFHHLPVFAFYRGLMRHNLYVYRNSRCMERAYWADRVIGAADRQEMSLQTAQHNLREYTIVLTGSDGLIASSASEGDRLEMMHWQPGRMHLTTHNTAQRFLVVSEVWDPGWRATIDGARAPVRLTNMTMLGLAVPAGDHQIVVEYIPPYWTAACGVTIASAAVVVLLGALAVAKRVRARKMTRPGQLVGDSTSRR